MNRLVQKLPKAKEELAAASAAFEELDKSANCADVAVWIEEEKRAQDARDTDPTAMDIYDIRIKRGLGETILIGNVILTRSSSGPTKADMELLLLNDEESRKLLQGSASILSLGLVLEQAQYVALWSHVAVYPLTFLVGQGRNEYGHRAIGKPPYNERANPSSKTKA